MDYMPIVERLERLRDELGMRSYQEFLDCLNQEAEEPFPYATARRYHRDREPSVSYIVEVSRVFGVSLEWLLYGKGNMLVTGYQAPSPDEHTEETIPVLDLESFGWSAGRQALFRDAWRRYLVGFRTRVPRWQFAMVGLYLKEFVLMPFHHSGFKRLGELSSRELDDFLGAMIGALELAMPDPGKGEDFARLGIDRAWGFGGRPFWFEEDDLPSHEKSILLLTRRMREVEGEGGSSGTNPWKGSSDSEHGVT